MITVIMPMWNGARFVDKAVASVVAQTNLLWELIIVDDGSTDDSLHRVQRWRDMVNDHFGEEKIRVYNTGGSNSGPQVGRNIASGYARYDLFAYLDQDDIFFPRRIESLITMFEKSDLVFAPYEILEKERLSVWNIRAIWERNSSVCSSAGEREPAFDAWVRKSAQQVNLSVPLGVANSRELYEEVGGFQPGILSGTDGVLWRRMADRGARIGFCPVISGRYNVRADSQARTKKKFSTGGTEIQKDHPLGPNGQYLDAEWFAELDRKKRASS